MRKLSVGASSALILLLACGGGGGSTSPAAPSQPKAPSILTAPTSVAARITQSIAFKVVADGTAPLSYQWKRNGVPLGGASGDTLNLTDLRVEQAGAYTVTVTNAAGSVTSGEAVLQVGNAIPLPPDIKPFGLYIAGDGRKWIASPQTDLVTVNSPATGQWAKVACGASTKPTGLALGGDQNVWVTLNGEGKVGQIVPQTAVLQKFPVGSGPMALARGANGDLWCTLSGEDKVARVTPSGQVTVFKAAPGAGPYGIAVASDGTAWFTALKAGRIGRIHSDGSVQEFECLKAGSRPEGIALGADGSVWYADAASGQVVKFQAAQQVRPAQGFWGPAVAFAASALTGAVAFDLSASTAAPSQMVLEPNGQNAWVSERGTGKVSRVGASPRFTVALSSPSGKPAGLVADPQSGVWVVEEEAQVLSQIQAPQPYQNVLSPTGSMSAKRSQVAMAPLSNGKVLVAGGWDGTDRGGLALAELYDPETGAFASTGSLVNRRSGLFPATTLKDGRILIAGGEGSNGHLAEAEIYDPATEGFLPTGRMGLGRSRHAATLLSSGTVLITGGYTTGAASASSSAELYDPSTGKFTPTGSMKRARTWHTSLLLPSGKVLVLGGESSTGSDTLEIYDPATGTFTDGPSYSFTGNGIRAQSLLDGTVLILAGKSAFLYDIGAGTILSLGVRPSVVYGTYQDADPVLLKDGRVLLLTSGGAGNASPNMLVEVFDPASRTFRTLGDLGDNRYLCGTLRLQDGSVLIVGGQTWANTPPNYYSAVSTAFRFR